MVIIKKKFEKNTPLNKDIKIYVKALFSILGTDPNYFLNNGLKPRTGNIHHS